MAQLKSTSVTGNLSVTGNVVASQIIKQNEINAGNKLLKANGETASLEEITNSISNAQTTANTATSDIATIKENATILTFKGIEDKIASLTTTDIAGIDAYATDLELANTKTAILGEQNYSGTIKGAYDAASAAQITAENANDNANSRVPKSGDTTIDGILTANQFIGPLQGYARYLETISNQNVWYGDSWKFYVQWDADTNNICELKTEGGYDTRATRAFKDADGNVISDTYLKLTGGTITGPLTIQSTVNGKNIAFQATPNNFIDASNEFNFIPTEYDGVIYINHKGKDGKTTGTRTDGSNKQITTYVFCNGRGDTTAHGSIEALSYNATSDARLKENFIPLTTQKSILDLPIYKFDFISGTKNQIGCKAQDLQEICPEIVNEDSNGYLSIQESKIVYLLIDEIKKLKGQINLLMKGGNI